MRDYGNFGGHTHFKRRMDETREVLSTITQLDEPIQSTGQGAKKEYCLDPSIVFVDGRDVDGRRPTPLNYLLIGELPTLQDFRPGALRFAESAGRRATFSSMLHEYASSPDVTAVLTELQRHSVQDNLRGMPPETLHEFFTTIDKGLTAYLHSDNEAAGRAALQEAILVFHRIFDSMLPYLYRLSNYFGRTYPGLEEDLFQTSAAENLRFLLEFDGGAGVDYCESFYARAQAAARGTMLNFLETITRHNKALSYSQYNAMQMVKGAQDVLTQSLGRTPTHQEILDRLDKVCPDHKLDIREIEKLSYKSTPGGYVRSLDYEGDSDRYNMVSKLPDQNASADLDRQIDNWLIEEEVQRIFAPDSPLSDVEKIVASLSFEVYSPHLRGAVYYHRPSNSSRSTVPAATFTYPHTSEDFQALLNAHTGADVKGNQVARILGSSVESFANSALSRALSKARRIYDVEQLHELIDGLD